MDKLTSEQIKQAAFAVGFDLCGITTPEIVPEARQRLLDWLSLGYHGEMAYMEKQPDRRSDPAMLLSNVRSLIMLGLNYYHPNSKRPEGQGRVSRYARGRDYHKVIEKKTRQLIGELDRMHSTDHRSEPNNASASAGRFKYYVDYGPMLERTYAVKAGLGYLGKNSMLINRTFGSYIFLSEILTDIELQPDDPKAVKHGRCGTCSRCIDACPTGAIVNNGTIDSRRCISYLTIERPSTIPETLSPLMGESIFGCDICQEVCPHNTRARLTLHEDLLAKNGVGEFLDARHILRFETREQFLALTAGTPLTRAKLEGLQRNAALLLQNDISRAVTDAHIQ